MRRVTFHPDFERDLEEQVEHLRARGDADGIRGLAEDLTALEETVRAFPRIGRELLREPDQVVRKLKLRRAPLFVWYTFEPDRDEITLVRLFHSKRRTPEEEGP